MTGSVAMWLWRFLCFSLPAAWGLWLGESGGANVGDMHWGRLTALVFLSGGRSSSRMA